MRSLGVGAARVALAIAAVVLLLDQLTKHWAVNALADDRIIDVVGSLRWNLAFNRGMAFSQGAGLGPIIGTRTWGGLIGMTGAPGLIDGGSVTVPTFSIYSRSGEWIIENQGVAPDIEVIDDPSAMSQGADPQLDRAIQEVVKALEAEPPAGPKRPAYRTRIVREPSPAAVPREPSATVIAPVEGTSSLGPE